MRSAEFDGIRAKLYNEALEEYPNARYQDIILMQKYLSPKKGDSILGFGEGNGLFVPYIARAVTELGTYLVTDPSKDQLKNLKKKYKFKQMKVKTIGVEKLKLPKNKFDKVWSLGAFHHCKNQEKAIKELFSCLKPNGKLVICDVLKGSKLAKHFDTIVEKYCITGHEVNFLSKLYLYKLLKLAGFIEKKIFFKIINLKWEFNSELDLGKFIYKLHALIKLKDLGLTEKKCYLKTYSGCEKILGVKKIKDKFYLNWPIFVLVAKK
jgi:ubiquinone/menaquinone biosynthesis C-methylase UbiE